MELTRVEIEKGVAQVILSDARKKAVMNPDAIAREFKDAGIDVEAVTVTKALVGISDKNYKWEAQVSENRQVILISRDTGNVIDLSKKPEEAYQFASEKISPQELKDGKTAQIGSSSSHFTIFKATSPEALQKEVTFAMEQADRANKGPMEQLLGKKDSIPQNISSYFEHPDFKEAARLAGRNNVNYSGVNYSGDELTSTSTGLNPELLQRQKTR